MDHLSATEALGFRNHGRSRSDGSWSFVSGLRRRESVSLGFVVDGSDDVSVFRRMWYTSNF